MNYPVSMKPEWDEKNRNRFQRTLAQHGWEVYRTLKQSTIFQKNTVRLEVDPWGAWIFEFKITDEGGGFVRTQGISDDRIDQIYSPGHDPVVLSFKHNRTVKKLSLESGEWVR